MQDGNLLTDDMRPSFSQMSKWLAQLPFPDRAADRLVYADTFGSGKLLPQDLNGSDRSRSVSPDTPFTEDLQQALGALERLVPGAEWKAGNDGGPNAEVHDPATGLGYASVGATPALALLSAGFYVATMLAAQARENSRSPSMEP